MPDALREQMELFAANGQVSVRESNSFAEASWASIYLGNRFLPRHHDPLAHQIDRAQLKRAMSARAELIERAANALPDHRQYVDSITALQAA